MIVTFLLAFSLHAMQQTLDIGQRNDLVRGGVTAAVDEWSRSRRCRVDPEAHSRISEHITASLPATKTKEELEQRATRARIFAFLDDLSVSLGPRPKECLVTADAIDDRRFQEAWFPPSTGILEVDGSIAGSPVYIDGKRKGPIPYAIRLNVGKHTWKTMKCEESIEIKEDEHKQVRCDNN